MALAALGACATAAPPNTASDTYCALYEPIRYALLDPAEVKAAAVQARPVRDVGNNADSNETIRQADRNNAKYDTICGAPLAPPG